LERGLLRSREPQVQRVRVLRALGVDTQEMQTIVLHRDVRNGSLHGAVTNLGEAMPGLLDLELLRQGQRADYTVAGLPQHEHGECPGAKLQCPGTAELRCWGIRAPTACRTNDNCHQKQYTSGQEWASHGTDAIPVA